MTNKLAVSFILAFAVLTGARANQTSRDRVTEVVTAIQRSDYEGNRKALKEQYEQLTPFLEDKELASRVRYWRGFDLWRDAINGFNESADAAELERLLMKAVDEFKAALAVDAAFVDAKIGLISSLGYVAYIHREDKTRVQECIAQISPLIKEAKEAAPDNPRLAWVLGPVIWYTPPERGGGLDKVIENYERGLEACAKSKPPSDPLDPSWGKPELLMSLGYAYFTKNPPDLVKAEQHARAAVEIVPYWHYARDIILPQIVAAKNKDKAPTGNGP